MLGVAELCYLDYLLHSIDFAASIYVTASQSP